MGTAILFTSGKGGTGKTTAGAAVASCLAASGFRTLAFDCDVGLKNLDIALGFSDAALLDFSDVICGRCTLEAAVVPHPEICNLFLLSAPAYSLPEDIDPEGKAALMEEIKQKFDYCIIDSPAGLGHGFRLAAVGADRAVIVVTADASSLRDAQRVSAELEMMGFEDTYVLINRVRSSILKKSCSNADIIMDEVGARLAGIVPEDKDVILAANNGRPLILYSLRGAAAAFLNTALRLTGEKVPLTNIR